MGTVLDTITTYKDNLTGGAFEALTVASGDSLALRFLNENADIELLEAWGGNNAHLCEFSIRSPLLHDNNRGIRFAYMFNPTESGADGNPQMFMSPYETQKYRPSDTLIVEANGTAADDVTFSQLVMYSGPGVPDGKFLTYEQVKALGVNLVGINIAPVPHATTSTYGATRALSADDDRLKANTWYALLGATSDLPVTTLAIHGPETANFRVSMPCHWQEAVSGGFFLELARRFNRALVPVFNANNKGNILVEAADVGGGTTPHVDLKFVELSGFSG